jgi:(E)-benzylidenesuccinyl-CoA hydratase
VASAVGIDNLTNLRYEKRDHIAIITIDQPDKANAVNRPMAQGLRAIWDDVRSDRSVRVVIVTGAGERHFCTGADLSGPSDEVGRSGEGTFEEEIWWTPRQAKVWKPSILAVNGLVAGAGLHFVCDCDIIVAAENAAFTDTHVNVGIVSHIDGIGLAKRIPLGATMRMALMGRSYRMTADRAYQVGLVDEVVPLADLMTTAETMAGEIAKNSPRAVSLTMQCIWQSFEMGHAEANEYGWALGRMHQAHPDFTEGPRAFMERREPNWAE